MNKNSKASKPAAAHEAPAAAHEAIGDCMQGYFQQHGAFRAVDVFQVLGSPADSVRQSVGQEEATCNRADK